jgi:predicted lipid-binding transport protein (Tim44 family)
MRPLSITFALALLSLLVGCSHSSQEEASSSPAAEVLSAAGTQPAGDTKAIEDAITVKDAGNAGMMLIMARDTCQIPKTDFDHLASYFSATLGQDEQLKGAFVGGAKAAYAVRQEAVNKDELEKLKGVVCPGVQRMLAALPPAKQG